MNDIENNQFLLLAWINALFGALFSEPVLANLSYLVSILGGIVYIASTIINHLKNKKP